MTHKSKLEDLKSRHLEAEKMGGQQKLLKRRNSGLLNARERLTYIFDTDSFREIGKFVTSLEPSERTKTPSDGKITGFGKINGRRVAAVANDLTVKGASSTILNAKKIAYLKKNSERIGIPLIFLAESSGARIPDTMGAIGMGKMGQDSTQYIRKRETPWASAILGPCFGSSAWYAALSDFVVMRRGSELAVSSSKVTSIAINENVSSEELGGWKLHSETTGLVDRVVNTDEEALDLIQKFLSYFPSNFSETPPISEEVRFSKHEMSNILSLVPEEREKVYDIRAVIEAISDNDSVFPMKERFGRSAFTCIARLNGKSVGFIANNPKFQGGAMDVNACDKITSFLVLCDSFNIPLIFLVDTPGFLIGKEGEVRKAPGKIMNYMSALQLCSVPKISVILRKDYGQAYLNMGGGDNANEVVAWPTAEVSFVAPEIGVQVVHGVDIKKDPKKYQELLELMQLDTSPYELARCFGVQDVIDPRETRSYLIGALENHFSSLNKGIGRHEMKNWPTTY